MSKSDSYKDHLLLNSEEVRGEVELMLRNHPIKDENSYIEFLNEIMIQVARGTIPPAAADSVREIANSIYVALANAATMAVLRGKKTEAKALPPPRQNTGFDFKPAYQMDTVDAEFVEVKTDE